MRNASLARIFWCIAIVVGTPSLGDRTLAAVVRLAAHEAIVSTRRDVIAGLASARGVSVDEMRELTTANARRLLSFP